MISHSVESLTHLLRDLSDYYWHRFSADSVGVSCMRSLMTVLQCLRTESDPVRHEVKGERVIMTALHYLKSVKDMIFGDSPLGALKYVQHQSYLSVIARWRLSVSRTQ